MEKNISYKLLNIVFIVAFALIGTITTMSITTEEASAIDDYPSDLKSVAADTIVDPWNFWNRECTSFCAWRLNNYNGIAFTNSYGGVHWGDAANWGVEAQKIGIEVNTTPEIGSIAWTSSGKYGHVAWVADVNGDSITVEEYNYNYNHSYNTRTVYAAEYSGFIHIQDVNPSVENATITAPNVVYNGHNVTPKTTVVVAGKTLTEGIDYTTKYSKNKNIGKATVVVTGIGEYEGSAIGHFNIIPKGADIKTLSYGSTEIKVTWKSNDGIKGINRINGYEVQHATCEDMSDAKITRFSSPKDNGRNIRRLQTATKYYVQIRTYRKIGSNTFYSNWSAIKSTTTSNCLTFTAKKAKSSISFRYDYAKKIQYSYNGTEWKNYKKGKKITLSSVGDRVLFRGTQVKTYGNVNFVDIDSDMRRFKMTGKIASSGSVTSLTDMNGTNSNVKLTNGCYLGMFQGCKSLTSAPELPATTLAPCCYACMFIDCTNLQNTPELPAMTLASSCYDGMFSSCKKISACPELPATRLSELCYESMFWGCSNLTQAPELPATILAEECYSGMFSNCTKLEKAPELPAIELEYSCYAWMFAECTKLEEPPELPATRLADWCYAAMFESCKSLAKSPKLHASELAVCCYNGMFSDCDSLSKVTELPAANLAPGCYAGMFADCNNIKLYGKANSAHSSQWGIPKDARIYGTYDDEYEEWNECMFEDTGGEFAGNPIPGTIYYQAE